MFIRPRASFQELVAGTRVAFTAPSLSQRLSDHFGLEAEVNLNVAPTLAQVPRRVPVAAVGAEESTPVMYVRNHLEPAAE